MLSSLPQGPPQSCLGQVVIVEGVVVVGPCPGQQGLGVQDLGHGSDLGPISLFADPEVLLGLFHGLFRGRDVLIRHLEIQDRLLKFKPDLILQSGSGVDELFFEALLFPDRAAGLSPLEEGPGEPGRYLPLIGVVKGTARDAGIIPLLDIVVTQGRLGVEGALGEANLLIRLEEVDIDGLDLGTVLQRPLLIILVTCPFLSVEQDIFHRHGLVHGTGKHGIEGGPGEGTWTLEVGDGVQYTQTDGSIAFEGDASGTIRLEDGSELSFQDVEKIEW